jgi:hypothetical protein
MTRRPFFDRRPFFAPEGEGGAGGDGGNTTTTTPPPPGGDTTTTTDPAPKWWEDPVWSEEERTFLKAKGLTLDDQGEVLRKLAPMYRNAETRLGRSPDTILDRPKEGQDLAEWKRQNAQLFGLPDKPEAYAVEAPEFWPKDAKWNADLDKAAQEVAFKHGVEPGAHKAYVELYAKAVKDLDDQAKVQLQTATDAMMGELTKDWGEQLGARITRARQAAAVVAEKAGLSGDGVQALSALISEKAGGDAIVVKMFDAIASMMGEDTADGLRSGANSLGMTPAEARAELQRLQTKGGDYYEAVQAGDASKLKELGPKIQQLSKLAAR